MPTTHTTQVEALPANPATGSIGGHKVTCTCGLVQTTSLSALMAHSMASAHLSWHAKAGK